MRSDLLYFKANRLDFVYGQRAEEEKQKGLGLGHSYT